MNLFKNPSSVFPKGRNLKKQNTKKKILNIKRTIPLIVPFPLGRI